MNSDRIEKRVDSFSCKREGRRGVKHCAGLYLLKSSFRRSRQVVRITASQFGAGSRNWPTGF